MEATFEIVLKRSKREERKFCTPLHVIRNESGIFIFTGMEMAQSEYFFIRIRTKPVMYTE